MGQELALTGYITPVQGVGLPTQPEAAIQAIRIFIGPVPVVLLILSVLFAWWYPISRESHKATLEALSGE